MVYLGGVGRGQLNHQALRKFHEVLGLIILYRGSESSESDIVIHFFVF